MRFSFADARRWQPSRTMLLTLTLGLQVLLLLRAYGSLLLQPGQFLFADEGDGAKNYFTFQACVQQPWKNGLRWFEMMNYPYGDYVFYTDNTPLLAVPVRLWSHYVADVGPYAIDVYHWLLLAGFLLSTLLLTAILRRLTSYWVLVLVFSVTLPWLNPQVSRLVVGHFNLSYSWVLLLGIWGLLNVYERALAYQPLARWVGGLVIGFILAGLIHLYYLPLLAVLTGVFFACWLLPNHLWLRRPQLTLLGATLSLVPMATCVLIIRAVDGYYALRSAKASGFDYAPFNLQFSALFRSPERSAIHYLIEPRDFPPHESVAYLGAFALYSITLLAGVWLLRPASRAILLANWRAYTPWPFLRLLLITGGVSLFIAFGVTYSLDGGNYVLHNYLNLLAHLKNLSEAVTQFRALGRFNWVFFWTINLLCIAGLGWWLRAGRWSGRWVVATGLIVLVIIDTRDAVKRSSKVIPNTLTNPAYTPEINRLIQAIEPSQYQGILPIPYYHVGSEDPELTIEDFDDFSRFSYQLSLRTRLPLLATKMSRTPPEHLVALRQLLLPTGPGTELRARLRRVGKPLLVLYDTSYYNGTNPAISQETRPKVREVLVGGGELPARLHLNRIAESGSLRLYRWDVQ